MSAEKDLLQAGIAAGLIVVDHVGDKKTRVQTQETIVEIVDDESTRKLPDTEPAPSNDLLNQEQLNRLMEFIGSNIGALAAIRVMCKEEFPRRIAFAQLDILRDIHQKYDDAARIAIKKLVELCKETEAWFDPEAEEDDEPLPTTQPEGDGG